MRSCQLQRYTVLSVWGSRRHNVCYDKCRLSWSSCRSFLVTPFLQFWSICSLVWSSLQHRQAAHGTILYACVRSGGCVLFPVSPLSLALTYQTVLVILLLTWHHKRFGNGGLFLVAHISTWLLCLCTFLCELVCILMSRNSAMGRYPLKGHSAVVAE